MNGESCWSTVVCSPAERSALGLALDGQWLVQCRLVGGHTGNHATDASAHPRVDRRLWLEWNDFDGHAQSLIERNPCTVRSGTGASCLFFEAHGGLHLFAPSNGHVPVGVSSGQAETGYRGGRRSTNQEPPVQGRNLWAESFGTQTAPDVEPSRRQDPLPEQVQQAPPQPAPEQQRSPIQAPAAQPPVTQPPVSQPQTIAPQAVPSQHAQSQPAPTQPAQTQPGPHQVPQRQTPQAQTPQGRERQAQERQAQERQAQERPPQQPAQPRPQPIQPPVAGSQARQLGVDTERVASALEDLARSMDRLAAALRGR